MNAVLISVCEDTLLAILALGLVAPLLVLVFLLWLPIVVRTPIAVRVVSGPGRLLSRFLPLLLGFAVDRLDVADGTVRSVVGIRAAFLRDYENQRKAVAEEASDIPSSGAQARGSCAQLREGGLSMIGSRAVCASS